MSTKKSAKRSSVPKGAAIPQRATETPRAAAAFAQYCQMAPAERSLRKLAEQGVQGERKVSARTATLTRWSSQYHWQERVKEYDAAQVMAKRDAREAARDEARMAMDDEHANLGRQQLLLAINRINDLADMRMLSGREAVALLKIAAELQRTALGAPSQVIAQQHTGTVTHEHAAAPDDPQAAALARKLIARLSETAR
jgi:hypothetical protein